MSVAVLCLALTLAAGDGPPDTGAKLTLDRALAEASGANLDLAVSRNAKTRSEAVSLGSWQGFLPRLDVSASFGRDYVGAQSNVTIGQGAVGNTPAVDYPAYGLQLSVSERLFDGLRTRATVDQAHAHERAASAQIDETSLATSFLVTQRFYAVVKAQQSLGVFEETAAQSKELVGRADALFAAGRVPRGDTLSARVNLGNDLINIESQRALLAQARSDLAVALGRTADPALGVEVPPELEVTAFDRADYQPQPLDQLVARGEKQRPARAREAALVEAAEQGVTAARADYFPAIGVNLTYTRQGQDFTGKTGVYGPLDRQYVATAAVVASWNLFNGLGTISAVDQAHADAYRARLSETQVTQQIGSEVSHARSTLIALGRSARIAEQNLASATEAVRLARERFDAGAATTLDVRDAQLKLLQARLTIVSNRSDFLVAFADLNRAVGGGL